MKLLDKITLILFSNIVLILAIVVTLLLTGLITTAFVGTVFESIAVSQIATRIAFGICIVCILLAIRTIFFENDANDIMKVRDGILMENVDGKLLISKETLESLVINVVRGFENTYNVQAKIEIDEETKDLVVYVTLNVKESVSIKQLSINLQAKIKEVVKKSSDLNVKEVNIKVKELEKNNENVRQN